MKSTLNRYCYVILINLFTVGSLIAEVAYQDDAYKVIDDNLENDYLDFEKKIS